MKTRVLLFTRWRLPYDVNNDAVYVSWCCRWRPLNQLRTWRHRYLATLRHSPIWRCNRNCKQQSRITSVLAYPEEDPGVSAVDGRNGPSIAVDRDRMYANVGDGLKNLALKACYGRSRCAQNATFLRQSPAFTHVRSRSTAVDSSNVPSTVRYGLRRL